MRFEFAMEILDLQKAGYPMDRLANILTREQWTLITELKAAMDERTYEIAKNK